MDLEAKCKIRNKKGFDFGYTEIVSSKTHPEMLMSFGLLKMKQGETYKSNDNLERIFLLLTGNVVLSWEDNSVTINRDSIFNENPNTLDVPAKVVVTIECLSQTAEITVHKTENETIFDSHFYVPEEVVQETRGKGTMNDAGTRMVRTIMDKSISKESNFMLGEDVHYPGRWAGFPSHSHNQPEIYFYRFYPENGFGLLRLGDQGVCLEQDDTVMIPPDLVHPQVAAPGYAMYFLWIIRHLEGNTYLGPDFEEQHLWAGEPDAIIWPDV
jgi:5-deoxy-glucuronate isomerase